MSTILKALQRLEEEKSSKVERSLEEEVAAPPRPAPGGRRWLPVGIALVAGVAVGLAGLLLWPSGGEPEPDAARVAAVQEQPSEPPPRQPAPPAIRRPRPAAPPPAAADEEPDVQVVDHYARRSAAEAGAEEPEAEKASPQAAPDGAAEAGDPPAPGSRRPGAHQPPRRRPERAPESARVQPPQVAALPAQRPQPAQPPPAPEPERQAEVAEPERAPVAAPPEPAAPPRTAAVRAEPRPEPAPAPAPEPVSDPEPEPAPRAEAQPVAPPAPPEEEAPGPSPARLRAVAERSETLRAELPELFVQSTVWHPQPERRVAVVEADGELLQLREGDRVSGLLVEEIEPTGVFFAHEGIALRRQVGER